MVTEAAHTDGPRESLRERRMEDLQHSSPKPERRTEQQELFTSTRPPAAGPSTAGLASNHNQHPNMAPPTLGLHEHRLPPKEATYPSGPRQRNYLEPGLVISSCQVARFARLTFSHFFASGHYAGPTGWTVRADPGFMRA